MGYFDAKTGKVVSRWGLFKDAELPMDQQTDEYRDQVYRDVAFRTQEQIQQGIKKHARILGVGKIIALLIVEFPVVIDLISLGCTWLGYTLSAISISAGFYKLAKMTGWLNTSGIG